MNNQIHEPLNYINQLFDQFITNPSNSPVAFDPSSSFLDLLKTNKHQIISINDTPVQQIPKNTLVRFRCMIQDTGLGQEMFISAYEKLDKNGDTRLHCYRYTDDPMDAQFSDHSVIQNEHLCERTLVYCISPPGENTWSKDAYNVNTDSLSNQLQRFELKEPNPTMLKKFPLPDQDHTAAIIKFYNDMAESVKVGQLIEVIGIRGQDLQKQPQQDEQTGFDSVLDLFADMPVIHAIAYNTLDAINSNPISEHEDVSHQTHEIRSQLIDYISSVFGGDTLTAEFVLLQLLSRVSVKNRGLKIGNFTLNVSGFPSHQTTEADKNTPLFTLNNPLSKSLAKVLDNLTVHSANLPLTIDGLNKAKFTPKSISENLEAGVLQLLDGTLLLVDETTLDEGQLVDPGVRNFQALQNLIQHQSLTYEFPYSQYDFDTDISVLSLSSSKSMLPNHCSVCLEPSYSLEDCQDNRVPPVKETLDLYRKYLHSAKYALYDIPEQVSEYIQTSFVNERKTATDNKTELPTQEELMLRMNLARLSAASFGETNLTQQRYDYVVELDKKRRSRMK